MESGDLRNLTNQGNSEGLPGDDASLETSGALVERYVPHLFETLAVGILLIDDDGQIVRANPAAESILGRSHEQMQGQAFHALEWPLQRPDGSTLALKDTALARVQATGQTVRDLRLGVRRADGTLRWVDAHAVPVTADDGQPLGMVAALFDCTDQVAAETALAASETQVQTLCEACPVSTYVWRWDGTDFRLIDYNRQSNEETGGKIGQFLGARACEFYEDSPEVRAIMAECYAEQTSLDLETPYRMRTTGEEKRLAVRVTYLPPDRVYVHAVDVTPRHAAEADRDETIRSLDRKRRLLLALSRAAENLHRARTPEQVYQAVGDELEKLGYHGLVMHLDADRTHMTPLHLTWKPPLIQAARTLTGVGAEKIRVPLAPDGFFAPLIAGGKTLYCPQTPDLVARAFPGLARTVLDRVLDTLGALRSIWAPLIIEGELEAILGVAAADLNEESIPAVTVFAEQAAIAIENARLLARLEFSQRRLQSLAKQMINTQEEERRRLAHALHDDAGQQLTALRLMLEMVGEDLPAGYGGLRRRIQEAADKTSAIMDAIRDLSRMLRPPALGLAPLSSVLRSLCREVQNQTGLAIRFEATAADEASENAGISLYRFLQEALTNVVKHAEAGRVDVRLEGGPDLLHLTVADDGQGFQPPPPNVWPPGLGLLGMQERLEALGGRFAIDSAPGRGTRVEASLPPRIGGRNDAGDEYDQVHGEEP